jgi:thiosulfate dehydrogenase
VVAACHGADGKTINFGTASASEYVGTLANDNPWEFVHKVRFGQPGETMPAGVEKSWSVQDAVDILKHAQTALATS